MGGVNFQKVCSIDSSLRLSDNTRQFLKKSDRTKNSRKTAVANREKTGKKQGKYPVNSTKTAVQKFVKNS
jgi:hypothetical protein